MQGEGSPLLPVTPQTIFWGLATVRLSANALLSKDEITTEVTVHVHARSLGCVANIHIH